MQFDDEPESYFDFLKGVAPGAGLTAGAVHREVPEGGPGARGPESRRATTQRAPKPARGYRGHPGGPVDGCRKGHVSPARIVAGVALVIAVGAVIFAMPHRSPEAPQAAPSVPTAAAAPTPAPMPPGRRSVTAEELLDLNGFIAGEHFTEADDLIRKLSPLLLEDSRVKLEDLSRVQRQTAATHHS